MHARRAPLHILKRVTLTHTPSVAEEATESQSMRIAIYVYISRNAIRKQTPRAVFGCEKFRSKTDPLEQNLAHNLSTVLIPGWPYTHVSVPGAFLNLPDAEKRCLDLICSWHCTLGQINPTVSRPYERYEGPAHSSTRYFGVWG